MDTTKEEKLEFALDNTNCVSSTRTCNSFRVWQARQASPCVLCIFQKHLVMSTLMIPFHSKSQLATFLTRSNDPFHGKEQDVHILGQICNLASCLGDGSYEIQGRNASRQQEAIKRFSVPHRRNAKYHAYSHVLLGTKITPKRLIQVGRSHIRRMRNPWHM